MSEDVQEIKDLHIENKSVCHISIFHIGETSMRIEMHYLFHPVYSY